MPRCLSYLCVMLFPTQANTYQRWAKIQSYSVTKHRIHVKILSRIRCIVDAKKHWLSSIDTVHHRLDCHGPWWLLVSWTSWLYFYHQRECISSQWKLEDCDGVIMVRQNNTVGTQSTSVVLWALLILGADDLVCWCFKIEQSQIISTGNLNGVTKIQSEMKENCSWKNAVGPWMHINSFAQINA